MALDVGRAIEEGFRRALARNGLMFLLAFFLLNMSGVFVGAEMGLSGAGTRAMTVPGNPVMLGVVGFVMSLLSVAVSIIAVRTFVGDETETVPDEYVRHNMAGAVFHMVVGVILFAALIFAGLILFVIPGLYLLTALFFWSVFVAVEDRGFLDAMGRSWDMTAGHRWQVFGLVLVIGIVNILVGVLGQGLNSILPAAAGVTVTQIFSGFSAVFALAAEADAYRQLRGDGDEGAAAQEEADTRDSGDAGVDYGEVVEGTVDEVKARVEDRGLDPAKVLSAERDGKDRVTLTSWLEDRTDGD